MKRSVVAQFYRRVLVVGIAGTLTAGLLGAVPANPASASAKPKDPRDVPALQSDRERRPERVQHSEFRDPAAPAASAHAQPGKDYSKSFDRKSSKLKERLAKGDVYRNTDGTLSAVMHSQDVNWRDAKGDWHAIDPRLVDNGPKTFRNASGRVRIELPKILDPSSPLATVAADGWSIAYSLEGARPNVKANVDGARATYQGVLDNLDIEERSLREGLRELLVIPQRPKSAEDAVFRFPLQLEGLTPASEADGSIAFRNGAGKIVSSMPAIVAWGEGEAPARNEGIVRPLSLQGGDKAWVVEVRIPGSFLADPARQYPVSIDPTIDAGHDTAQYDAFGSSADKTGNYNGERQKWNGRYVNLVGYDNYPSSEQYTYQFFDTTPLNGHDITSAVWENQVVSGSGDRFFRMYPVESEWSAGSVTWNTLPGHRQEHFDSNAPADGGTATMDLTQWVYNWVNGVWPNRGIAIDSAGRNSAVKFAASEEPVNNFRPRMIITYFDRPPSPGPALTPNGEKIIKGAVKLTGGVGVDAEGDPLTYSFAVSTAPDPEAGTVIETADLASPSTQMELDGFRDGVTYFWRMSTFDGINRSWSEYRSFTVDRRFGMPTSVPTDSAGPVTANLATGNAFIPVAGPSIDTTGGPIGIGLAYNSMESPKSGLTGTYTANADPSIRMVRRDARPSFDWGMRSPGGPIPEDDFRVRWEGWVTVPRTAVWKFGAWHDNAVTIRVNGVEVMSVTSRGVHYGAGIPMTAGTPVPITIDYHDFGLDAFMQLLAHDAPTAPAGLPGVPSEWLSTGVETLPDKWSVVGGGLGTLAYTSATLTGPTLVLNEPGGGVHQYTRQSDQSWKPTVDGDDVVTNSVENGQNVLVVAASDGVAYTFDDGGRLLRAVSAADDRNKPAAARYEYDGASSRLARVVDPVGGATLDFVYAGGGAACPINPAAGLAEAPPNGMLCEVKYPAGTDASPEDPGRRASMKLFYSAKKLVRVENPGSAVTDFAYDSSNRITKLREPAATDVVAADPSRDNDSTRTLIAYDTIGRVAGVTLPEPLPGAARPGRTYQYPFDTETLVKVSGAAEPGGYSRRVIYNAAGLVTREQDAAGLATAFAYTPAERVISTLGPTANLEDPAALKHTNVYDHAGRVVEAYGPAPASCFGIVNTGTFWVPGTPDDGWRLPGQPDGYTGERPTGTCTTPPVPVERTAYDRQGDGTPMRGLAAAYWNNVSVAGAPASHATGVGTAGGELVKDWGTGQPEGVATEDGWSARFTGEIELPTRGTWTLRLCADDGVRLFLDDAKLIDDWRDTGNVCRDVDARNYGFIARKRIRIDYYERTHGANIGLYWKLGGETFVPVPGDKLAPRYGLETSTVDADGKETGTEYARPEYSAPTATRVGAPGTGLLTRTAHETPGAGYMRRTRRTMPKGDGGATDPTATSYDYYAASADPAPANDCGGGAGVGLSKSTTGPDPDGTQTAMVWRRVYDKWNRLAGMKVDGDPRWSCTIYDSRGRVTGSVDPSGKAETIGYSTPGQVHTTYVDSSGTTHTTREKLDLLGRVYSYTDEHGTETRKVFDQAGRLTETWRRFSNGEDTKIEELTYRPDASLASSTEYLSGAPRTTTYSYDAATGRPTTTTRPNGVATTTAYDQHSGATGSIEHNKQATRLSNWTYGRSAAGRITSEVMASDVTPERTRGFAYDAYGRLVTTTEGSNVRNYAYDANSNRCALATNCAAPTFTYDNADRLKSSPYATSYTYDDHGNMTSFDPAGGSDSQTVTHSGPYDTAVSAAPVVQQLQAKASGVLQASGGTSETPSYYSGSPSGSLPTSGAWTTPIPVRAATSLSTALSWTSSTTGFATLTARYKDGAGAVVKALSSGSGSLRLDHLTAATPGTYTLELLNTSATRNVPSFSAPWSATVAKLTTATPVLGAGATWSTAISTDAAGKIATDASWTPQSQTKTSAATGFVGMGGAVDRTIAATAGPLSASVDWAHRPAYEATTSSGALPGAGTWTTQVPVRGRTYVKADLSWTASSGTFAPLTVRLKNPSGTVVATTSGSGGSAALTFGTTDPFEAVSYTLEIVNSSSSTAVPSWSLPWSTTNQARRQDSGVIAPGSTARLPMTIQSPGHTKINASWPKSAHNVTASPAGNVGIAGVASHTLAADAAGPISASVDWNPSPSYATGTPSGTLAPSATWSTAIPVRGTSYIRPDLTWTRSTTDNNTYAPLELRLKNAAGTVVARRLKATGRLELGGDPRLAGWGFGFVTADEAATYTLEIANTSSTTPVPSWSMQWSATSVVSTQWGGSIAPGGATEKVVTADANGYVMSDVSYAKGAHPVSASIGGLVGGGATATGTVPADAPGPITAKLDWSPTTQTVYYEGSVGAGAQVDRALQVGANGDIHATLKWTDTAVAGGLVSNLALVLLDPSGNEVKRSDGIMNEESLTYTATGVTPPATAGYTLRVLNQGPLPTSYTLSGDHPALAALDFELWSPDGTKVASSTGTTSATLAYTVPAAATGTYSFKVVSKNGVGAKYDIATTYPHLDHARLYMRATDMADNTQTNIAWNTGQLNTDFLGTPGASYRLRLENWSADIPIPSFSATTVTPKARIANLDLELWNPAGAKVASTASTSAKPETLSYNVPANATGDYVLKVLSRDHDADYSAQASFPHLEFPRLTASVLKGGLPVASSTSSSGALTLDYLSPDSAQASVELRNDSTSGTLSYGTTSDWPNPPWTDLDLELWSPAGVKVAGATNQSSTKPEMLTYDVPANATGNYTLKIRSNSYDADWSLSETHQEGVAATVTGRLKNSKGTVVAAATSSSGTLQFDYLSESTQPFTSHTLELQNTAAVPATGAALTVTAPKRHYGSWQVDLKNSAGAVIATGSGGQIVGLSAPVEPGNYTLVSTPSGGGGTFSMTTTVPGEHKPAIAYDANDHAIGVDDGVTDIRETLSPEGRVLRRVVTNKASGAVTEDVIYGYADTGDSPAYSRPAAGGVTTTYLDGLVYTGTEASWSLTNAHGDIAGTVDASGAFTPVPMADEFGVGNTPTSRLGWLGGHDRFGVGGSLGLVRMGVRLYDPLLGRFTSVDPVEGGSANDYDYVAGDPVNNLDLDGRFLKRSWNRAKKAAKKVYRRPNPPLVHRKVETKIGGATFELEWGEYQDGTGEIYSYASTRAISTSGYAGWSATIRVCSVTGQCSAEADVQKGYGVRTRVIVHGRFREFIMTDRSGPDSQPSTMSRY